MSLGGSDGGEIHGGLRKSKAGDADYAAALFLSAPQPYPWWQAEHPYHSYRGLPPNYQEAAWNHQPTKSKRHQVVHLARSPCSQRAAGTCNPLRNVWQAQAKRDAHLTFNTHRLQRRYAPAAAPFGERRSRRPANCLR